MTTAGWPIQRFLAGEEGPLRRLEEQMSITCGIAWAETHHDVALADEEGTAQARARARTETGVDGVTELLALIAQHGGSPQETPVAIETDKNLLVVALPRATVHGVPDQPAGRGPLPGAVQPIGSQVRRRRRSSPGRRPTHPTNTSAELCPQPATTRWRSRL